MSNEDMNSLYLGLASLNALVSHLNLKGQSAVTHHSLNIRIHRLEETLRVDQDTVLQLDLIINHQDNSTKNTLANKFHCLT